MKSRILLLSLTAIAVVAFALVLSVSWGKESRLYHPGYSSIENGIDGAIKWISEIRNNSVTGTVTIEDIIRARKQIAELKNNKALGITWNELGPNNIGGRTRAILIDKNNRNLLYAGAVSGGLWKSTTGGTSWEMITSFPDLNINCIGQNPLTGAIYVGTGESYAMIDYPYGTPGFLGTGLYESTDGGATWAIYQNAKPISANEANLAWAFVNRIAFDPSNGRMYVATNRGLQYWSGTAWVNPVYLTGTTPNNGICDMVTVGPDRTVVAVVGNKVYISPGGSGNGDAGTFVDKSPTTSLGRTEIAIAPSNPNYIYCQAASSTGALKGIWKSVDRGDNWTLIGPAGSPTFALFGTSSLQGDYDNVISVSPADPNFVLCGGINIWVYTGGNFVQITSGYEVHVDIHAIVFDRTDPNTVYVGCDGGLYKTTDLTESWLNINKNYSVTQMYSVANSKTGQVMAGTQDNNSPYLSRTGIDPKAGRLLYDGDGGWSAFSAINPAVFFGTMQYGGIWRSPDEGATYQAAFDLEFLSPTVIAGGTPGLDPAFGSFVTPLIHWESFEDYYSTDSVVFKADTIYAAGDVVTVKSHNNMYPFLYTLPVSLNTNDTLPVQDVVASKFFVALESGVWMTKQALNFAVTPSWFRICNVPNIKTMTISDDGNYLFVGTGSGSLIRISNIRAASDSLSATVTSPFSVIEQTTIESWSGRYVTSIAVDPNDPSRVVATLGNYDETNYIYYSENALDPNPTFISKQGTTVGKKLPAMPLYASLIEFSDGNRVLVGTEYGVFATADITSAAATIEWSEENNGMSRVPVYGIRQQTRIFPGMGNTLGAIYIGTHGRGFFESNQYVNAVPEEALSGRMTKPSLRLYPNPVVDITSLNYTLPVNAKVTVNIFDLNGRMVKSIELSQQYAGIHQTNVDCSSLNRGTYIMQIVAGKESSTTKFVVTK